MFNMGTAKADIKRPEAPCSRHRQNERLPKSTRYGCSETGLTRARGHLISRIRPLKGKKLQ